MRRLAPVLVALLAGCFHLGEDALAHRPVWRAGDTWTLLTSDPFGGLAQIEYEALGPGPSGTWIFRVRALGTPQQTLYASPDTLRFSADPANASRPPHWPWPLTENETWNGTDLGTPFQARARADRLKTEMGAMDTVAVSFTNATGPIQDVWFAPVAKFWARVEDHPTGTVSLLASYRVS